jgi:hypothetical protein
VERSIPAECDFFAYDMTLLATGGITSALAFDSPAKVGPPVAATTSYTLTAMTPGVVELRASVFGENYCNGAWTWSYRSTNTATVIVAHEIHYAFIPLLTT